MRYILFPEVGTAIADISPQALTGSKSGFDFTNGDIS
jgi:hypothetical protein